MSGNSTAVFGIYTIYSDAESCVEALKTAGFRNTHISVLFPQNVMYKDSVHEKASKGLESDVAGTETGAIAGGVLGWIGGIGALSIPGLGPFIAAGPIATALAGVGVEGTIGGITGALIGMGIPEYEAKRYEGRVKDGEILLSVHSEDSDWTRLATQVLDRTGAQDIVSTGEASGDYEKSDAQGSRIAVGDMGDD